MKATLTKIQKHFDDAASNYDNYKYNSSVSMQNIFNIRKKLLIKIIQTQISKNSTALDCGCGTGEVLISLNKKGYHTDGFDISNEMIRITKEKVKKNNIKNVEVCQDNICSFKRNKKYDVVIAFGVFQYLNRYLQKQAYKHILQSIKPNGLFITSYGNSIFSLFTFNKFTVDFFKENIIPLHLWSDKNIDEYISVLLTNPTMEREKGVKSETAHGFLPLYLMNPLTIKEELNKNGFDFQGIKFFHFHALPPLIKKYLNDEFSQKSASMEIKYAEHWLGYIMAYQFLIYAKPLV